MADLAAMRPSAWEPEENLCEEAPEASPAQKSPFTVAMFSYPQKYSGGAKSSGPLTQAPEAPEWEPMKYGSAAAISEDFSSGAVLVAAHRMAWEMVMSRKSSQASDSTSFSFFLTSLGSLTLEAILLMASSVRMEIGPLPCITSRMPR